jgi:hypothetical protein
MITVREVTYSVYGAWRLARLDRSGIQHFDTSLEGYWRSFFAAAIIAPAHVALVLLDSSPATDDSDWLQFWLVKAIAYVIGWTVWPLVMFYAAKAIDREPAYLGYIVAYNWAQVIGTGLFLVVSIVAGTMLPTGALNAAFALTIMVLLAYQWFIARTVLDIGGGLAAGLVVLDLVVSMMIGNVALGLSGAGAG